MNCLNFGNYVKAGYPAIIMKTHEEKRAIAECRSVAKKEGMSFAIWSKTKGFEFYTKDGKGISNGAPKQIPKLENVLSEVRDNSYKDKEQEGLWNILYCILDFHPFIKSPDVWRQAKDDFELAKSRGITYVFISACFDVPPELEREVSVISLPLPTLEDIEKVMDNLLSKNPYIKKPADKRVVAEAALGLTAFEVENTFSLSAATNGCLDTDIIKTAKQQIICNEGILDYKPSKETLDSIGGLKGFKSWAVSRLAAFSPEAKKYGLPYPKGVLLVGIPGCGKSLIAKALANIWQKPLLTLDVGKLFNKFQGETDRNTRLVFQKAEAMAPAVLVIDEIEKAFAGANGSGETDGGTTVRMFGNFLTWLQEKEAPVFVIPTANDVSKLPSEFTRKGRFDEIFFIDLPDETERKEITEIQLKKYKRDPANFEIGVIAEATENYTGAEIEQVIISSLFYAYNDGAREVTTADILTCAREITPMATGIAKDRVEYLRKWADERGVRRASGNIVHSNTENLDGNRVIRNQKPKNVKRRTGKKGGRITRNEQEE